MAMEYATVTGRIVIPGTTTGIPGELRATPLTEGGVLAFPVEDYTTIGPARADVTADGTLDPDLQIPTDVPDGTYWRLVFHPKGKGNLPVRLGDYAITTDSDIADLVQVELIAVPPGTATGGGSSSLIVVSGGSVDLDNEQADGYLIGYKVTATTIIEGVSFAAGTYIFERDSDVAGGWTKRVLEAGDAFTTSDVTAPTVGTLAGSSITDTTFTLTVSGASDAVALHTAPYAFSTDNGSTWTAYQSSPALDVTGKTASTAYQCRHRVKDAAGNVSTGTAITVTTTAAVLPSVTENFNRTDGTTLNGLTTTTGGATLISPARSVAAGDNATNATTVSNAVTVPGGTSNEGRNIAILTSQQNYEVSVDYTIATASSAFQVRLAGRASVPDDTTNALNSVVLIIKGDGTLGWESSGVSGAQALASGIAITGNLKLRCVGTTFSAYINNVQVGSSWTQSKTGGYACAGVYNIGSSMDNFKVQNL